MPTASIYTLADLAQQAQSRIQIDYAHLNPVIHVLRKLRESGFAADALTIECLSSGKRLLFIVHDDDPQQVQFQSGFRDQDPGSNYTAIALSALDANKFYQLIVADFA